MDKYFLWTAFCFWLWAGVFSLVDGVPNGFQNFLMYSANASFLVAVVFIALFIRYRIK